MEERGEAEVGGAGGVAPQRDFFLRLLVWFGVGACGHVRKWGQNCGEERHTRIRAHTRSHDPLPKGGGRDAFLLFVSFVFTWRSCARWLSITPLGSPVLPAMDKIYV